MTDTYAAGFLDGWACAAETLRTRFHLTARDAASAARIDSERLVGVGGHSDPPRPWFVGPQPSLVREMRDAARHQQATERILSEAREQVANTHAIDLREALDCHQSEAKRNGPLAGAVGPAVKPQAGYVSNSSSGYGDAADEAGHSDPPEGKPWLVGPREPLRSRFEQSECGGLHLVMAGAGMHCVWAAL